MGQCSETSSGSLVQGSRQSRAELPQLFFPIVLCGFFVLFLIFMEFIEVTNRNGLKERSDYDNLRERVDPGEPRTWVRQKERRTLR